MTREKDIIAAISDKVLLCDGGMGTMLYSKGIYIHSCFDELNTSNPRLVEQIHDEFIQSGVDIIETNTFGANRYKLKKFGLEQEVMDINRNGVALAKKAAGDRVWVAGSVGPLGLKIEPWGPTSIEEAAEAFEEQIQILVEEGVDLLILETFSDINEVHQAIKAARKIAKGHVLVAEMTIEEDGNSLYGTTPEVFTKKIEEWGADIIGVNCSVGPEHILQCIEKMTKATEKPLSAMPNAGIPRNIEGRNIYMCSPEYMAEYTKRYILNGVKLVGGCCGTTPAHIRAMKSAIKALEPPTAGPIRVSLPEDKKETLSPEMPRKDKSLLANKIDKKKFVVSLEIVPPRGHDPSKAIEIAETLHEQRIDCVNIPDGPRASARMSAMALAIMIRQKTQIEPILHYTCRDRNLLGMQSDLIGLYAHEVKNVLIVTGDPPKLGDYPDATAVFDVDSIGLTNVVHFLNRGVDIGGKILSQPTGFHIGVCANPGAINLEYEISRFEWKVDAGAEYAITQPVFDLRLLENFLKKIQHVRIPILAGIWPLFSLRNAQFMHNEVPGASVPQEIMARMRKAQEKSPEHARQEGVAIAREVFSEIKDRVEGVQISPPLGRYELALSILNDS